MNKILQICDSKGWAIDKLASAVAKFNPHYQWKRIYLHPRDLEANAIDLGPVIEAIKWADVIDVQYWRSYSQLIEKVPEIKGKPVVLTHHNEKNLLSYPWPENTIHIAKTKYSENVLKEHYKNVHYIANSFDHTQFDYIEKMSDKKVVGYIGRIVPWKGLKEIARACYELGYPLMVMGKHDKLSYFNEIPQEHRDNIQWDYFNCEDDERKGFFEDICVYVGNSGSGREVGTLGFIEALASGVPVVTTPAGLAADIGEDGENMLMVGYDDYDGLKDAIQRVVESPSLQSKLRKAGWETIRNYNDERMAYEYRKVFQKITQPGLLVSVIIPTTMDRAKETIQILESLKQQTYKNIEAVLVFDQTAGISEELTNEKIDTDFPVTILSTGIIGGYNLAAARNMGVIESNGEYLMFCDSRLKPATNAIEEFLKVIQTRKNEDKVWLFGEKGGEKSNFVENFSLIRRKHLIEAGMFNERITSYGGMSQELRTRFARQGFEFGYTPTARAEQMIKSGLSPAKRKGIIAMKNLLYKLNLY